MQKNANARTKGKVSKRPQCHKSRVLLAKTREPPIVVPVVVVLLDIHLAVVVPAVESGIAPPVIGVLPVRTVGMLIREGGVALVHCGERIRVSGFEPTGLVFLLQIGIRDVATDLEEDDFHFVALALRHRVNDGVDRIILFPTRCVECLLRGAVAVDRNPTNDGVRTPFNTGTKYLKHLLGESVALVFQDHLNGVLGK